MLKLSCLVFFLITIGNCSSYEHIETTEISRNFRNYENQRDISDAKSVEYQDRPYDEEYIRGDSDAFEGEKLIGKWRTSGAALEPKWRDGDSLPLVPFDAAKQNKNYPRPGIVKDSSKLAVSNVPTRLTNLYEKSSRIPDEGTIEKIPVSLDYRPSLSSDKNERYSLEENYERRYNPYDDSPTEENTFQHRIKTKFPSTIEISRDSEGPTLATEKNDELSQNIENDEILSTSRYRDTFQSHPNEYELNDEEYQKPRPRKRRPPQNYEFLETRAPTYSITWSTEKYTESTKNMEKIISTKTTRKPEITTRRRNEEKRNSTNREKPNMDLRKVSENAELKTLLKMQQIEGLSLSEILQRRNLTLEDLLKGKPEVLNVLKSNRDEDSSEIIGVKRKIFEPQKLEETTESMKWGPGQGTTGKSVNSTGNEISTISGNENDVGKKNNKRKGDFNGSVEKSTSAESENVQIGSNDNEKLSAIVRLTKPIILPRLNLLSEKSSTNYRVTKDSLENYQNDDNSPNDDKKSNLSLDEDEIMEFSDFTTNQKISSTILPEETTSNGWEMKFDDSGSTLSIEHILSPTEQTATIVPNDERKSFDTKFNSVALDGNNSNDSDIFGIFDFDYQSDEPREIVDENDEESTMSDQAYEKTTINIEEITENSGESLLKNHQIFSTSNKPYEVVISEIEPEARAEIFELFSSGSSAKRLERLLKSRNMSIDELIELRKRGSSKVHLAEVSRTREKLHSRKFNSEPEIDLNSSRDETTETILRETTTDDLSNIEIESTSFETTERGRISENETNISSIGTERTRIYSTTVINDRNNQQLLDLLKSFDSLPFSVRPESPDSGKTSNRLKTKISSYQSENIVEKRNGSLVPTSLVEVGLVEEIIEEDSISVDNETTERNFENNYSTVSSKNDKEKKSLSKVRPSIIASGAILGVTIVVFLAIFIVCRIRQKQKYTYRNTFSRAVFQGPVMTARKLSNSSSLNTIMVNVMATSTTKRPERRDDHEFDDNFECKSDIENDSLDANDSWDTIPDFMK